MLQLLALDLTNGCLLACRYTISSFYSAISIDIFEVAAALECTVSVRFFEVYGGKAYDLLAGGARCAVQESAKGEVIRLLDAVFDWVLV